MAAKPSKPRFEEALAEVEKMVAALESGEMPLEEAIAGYEKGIRSVQACYEILEKAESKLLVLQKDLDGKLKARKARVTPDGVRAETPDED